MKKIFMYLLIFLFSISLTSCFGSDDEKENDDEEKMVAVNELTFVNKEGVSISLTNESDFFTTLESCGISIFDINTVSNQNIGFKGSLKVGDNETIDVKGNHYYKTLSESLFVTNANFKGDKNIFTSKEYTKYVTGQENDNAYHIMETFNHFTYKNEVALGGSVMDGRNPNNNVNYTSKKYPLFPTAMTDFGSLHGLSDNVRRILHMFNFFDVFTTKINDAQTSKEYVFEEYVTRSVKLYEGYIVFEQVSPFTMEIEGGLSDRNTIYYLNVIKSGKYSLTQTMKYNINTNEVESISLKGNALSVILQPMVEYVVDLKFSFAKLNEDTYSKEVNDLVSFVKANADK